MVLRAVAVGVACLFLLPALAGCARNATVATPTVILVRPVDGAGLTASFDEPASEGGWSSREEVEVEWHGSWWPAIVLEKRGDRCLVHYDGYGAEWDEVVGPERIRERRAQPDIDDSSEVEVDPDP